MSASKSNFVGDNDSGNSTAIEKLAQEIQNSKETQSFQKITKDIHGQQEPEK
ncbi:hypothetical protein [Spiroplasma endosymbiont of Virgichneumon dumeticola]|uniref:hypothetical protein n=1 Tax=Spiroplasma endosymbiont of Virgichneumon dumeticola TaxID=3139323 RepID=UPI0035C8ACEE